MTDEARTETGTEPDPEPRPETRACRGCGKRLFFVRDGNGRLQPLDAVAPVFTVERDMTGAPVAQRLLSAYVSHFATCPKADAFSRGRR